jgi:hypothetical protein
MGWRSRFVFQLFTRLARRFLKSGIAKPDYLTTSPRGVNLFFPQLRDNLAKNYLLC